MCLWMRLGKIIILMLILVLSSCASHNTDESDGINVVCSGFPAYDFARNIAGDGADIKMLIPPGTDIHSFDPKPADIIAVENADVFIYVGGESDEWARDILESSETKPGIVVGMIECVDTLDEEIKEGMEAAGHSGEEEDHEHGAEADEHVWTSPKNAQLICEKITEALCAVDPVGESLYRDNFLEYSKKLQNLDEEFKEAVSSGVRKTVIFGDRFPFRYLVEEYGLDYYAAFAGCAELTEPSAKTVAFLIDIVKAENIPVVFYVEFSNHKICDTISEETGSKSMLLHSCHNVTKSEFESGIGYVEIMQKNAQALREALADGTDKSN